MQLKQLIILNENRVLQLSNETLDNLDYFLSSPGAVLSDASISELQNLGLAKTQNLYRALNVDSHTPNLLGVRELKINGKVNHTSTRATSWTASVLTAKEIIEDPEFYGSEPYIIISAEISRANIVLDTNLLSGPELLSLRGNDKYLASIVRRQQEVIVAPGTYHCSVVEYFEGHN